MRTLVLIGMALTLSACLTPAQTIYGPDAKRYTRIECNGAIQTLGACYDKANEVCPNGYVLADQDQREQGRMSTATANTSGSNLGFSGQATGISTVGIYRSIVVACK